MAATAWVEAITAGLHNRGLRGRRARPDRSRAPPLRFA